jgi:peptidoglycan/xylan/chitin deacetylase (PgdA/CDA1 family)
VLAGGAVAAVRGRRPGKRALAFHDVPDVARFRDFLDRLLAEYEVLGLEDWLTAPAGDRTQLALTFDDGYASWHDAVAPLLQERGVPAAFFVTSDLVGLRGDAGREFARTRLRRTRELTFIGRAELEQLSEHPLFEVGAHTATHADLGSLGDPVRIREEVARGRELLEDWLGTAVRWFAYPFGTPASVPAPARAAVEECGFEAAFTLIPGWWEPGRGDRLAIGRDGVDPALPAAVARAWLRGGYDRFYALRSTVR